MVLDHYLIVKQWTPNFDPTTDTTEKLLVWIRFPTLHIEYYDRYFLMKVGKLIRVDHAIEEAARGKFACLCVEVDIKKPLLAKFKLRRKVHRIKYEGMHMVCFQCGVYDHRQEGCSLNEDNDIEKLGDMEEDKMAGEDDGAPVVADKKSTNKEILI